MTDTLRKAAEQARRTLKKAFNRIHCLPRTSDTELANEIEKNLATLDAALAAEWQATPSDAELVERLRYNASIWQRRADDNHPLVKDQLEAAAAIERLTRLCAAYEGTIKADERELDNADETIERFEKALAAEREALADERRGHKATAEALFDMKARAEAAEAERDKATEERNDIFYYWSRLVGEAQERVKELEAKASSPKL